MDGKKSKEFQKQKNRFIDLVESYNQENQADLIFETGFYTTKFAKVYIGIIGLLALIGVFRFLGGEVKNPIPLLMVLGLFGVVIPQIFKKRKDTVSNKSNVKR